MATAPAGVTRRCCATVAESVTVPYPVSLNCAMFLISQMIGCEMVNGLTVRFLQQLGVQVAMLTNGLSRCLWSRQSVLLILGNDFVPAVAG